LHNYLSLIRTFYECNASLEYAHRNGSEGARDV
jgi:hypothetical protein